MSREIKTVGVIGLGTMGAGIVEVFAKAGLQVLAIDGTPELAERGKGFLTASLGRALQRGKLSQADHDAALAAVTFGHERTDLASADLVIEAVPERLEIKTGIFTALDEIVDADAVLASNTSSLSLTQIAAATKHPQRVIGMHFFNPAPVLKLVEVITTLLVDEPVVTAVSELASRLGKRPVVVGDRAGFVANALLITYLARAIRTYETGHVSREDLDDAARIGLGLPMGPLTLSDLIGLDVVKEVCDVLYAATKEPSAAPPALLTQMVTAGRLGRKTGRGFYAYDRPGSATVTDAPQPTAAVGGATKVAVIGAGEVAQELVSVLGPDVTAYDGAGIDADLTGIELAFLVGSLPEGEAPGEDDDLAPGWFTDAVDRLPDGCVVAVTDDLALMGASRHVSGDAQLVPVRVHEETKGGQLAEVGHEFGTPRTGVDLVAGTLRAAGLRTIVARERAGFVADALLLPHLNDAVKMFDSGYASVADIDAAMVFGCGYRQGPFAYIDDLGPGEVALGLQAMHEETGEPALYPSPLLDEYAAAGQAFTG